MTIEVFSSQELNNFYTGSFFGDAYTFGQVEEDALGFINQGASNYVSLKRMAEFIRDLLNHSNKGAGAAEDSLSFQLKDNRRFFVTFCESGTPPESSSFTPIILGRQGTLSGSLATNTYAARAAGGDFDLSDFSTVEIVGGQTNVMPSQGINQPHLTFGGPGDESYGQDGYGVPVLNIKDTLFQDYISNDPELQLGGATISNASSFQGGALARHPGPTLFETGSILFSRADITIPSILVPLKKTEELPNGTGEKPFIIIPENLHPFIKDNLQYFLIRAGVNVSGDTSPFIKLDETNRNLP
jgi:hypothetical protein